MKTCKKHFETMLLKESTQWDISFYLAMAIATVVYSQNVTTNMDQFQQI